MSDKLESTNNKRRGFLVAIERIGNKVPHTLALFIGIVVLIFISSLIFSLVGVTAINPSTGELIKVKNLVSIEGLVLLLTKFTSNFASFPILGVTIVVGAGMGLCEVGGFFTAVTKFCFANVRQTFIAFFIAFLGVFMCSLDGAVSMVIVPTIAATIYLSMGKNPLIGIFSGFAAAATGAAMEFIPGFWQVVLTPLTIKYAQLYDPKFTMPIMSDYYAVVIASILAVLVNTFITVKFLEPRFRNFQNDVNIDDSLKDVELTEVQKSAVKSAGWSVLIYLILLAAICIPANSFMRGPSGSLIMNAPLMASLENLLFLFFLIPGFVYARKTGQISNMKDFANLLAEGLKSLLPFIVLAIVIGQFIAFFEVSNLGQVVAIKGGQALLSLSLSPQVTLIILFLMYSVLDIIIISGSTKFLLFAPIVIPMMMQLNIHPAFTQFVLRMADGSTNNISPFNPFFPVVLTLCMKYDKKCGIGTAISSLLPYAIGNIIVFISLILIWNFIGLPIGVGGNTIWLH